MGLAAGMLAAAGTLLAEGYPVGWRGDGTGRFPDADPPVAWSSESNVVWKTRLPNWSNGSPILAGDRVFTCAEPATLFCLSAADGRVLWQQSNTYECVLSPDELEQYRKAEARAQELRSQLHALEKELAPVAKGLKDKPEEAALKAEQTRLTGRINPLRAELAQCRAQGLPATHGINGYSTPTPASDGRHVYVLFGTGVAACHDLNGKRRWARLVEKPVNDWGHSASPLLVGDRLIVHVRRLTALDAATGATVWQTDVPSGWGSPVRVQAAGEDRVVTPAGVVVAVRDGAVRARLDLKLDFAAPIVQGETAFFIQHGGGAATLSGATNAVATLRWRTSPTNERYYASALWHNGLLYALMQHRVLSVLDGETGAVVYSRPVPVGGTAYPSLALAGPYLYVRGDSGQTVVLRPGREYGEVAKNALEPFRSCPLFEGRRLYVRTLNHLYCIGR
jgi:outer membrane protein assembly factor BamB